ncbi:hypothetical protein HRbin30_03283 [bacterium HR30]|nr:hypothetical protein HRbin30_03283 [bacterium HR30]
MKKKPGELTLPPPQTNYAWAYDETRGTWAGSTGIHHRWVPLRASRAVLRHRRTVRHRFTEVKGRLVGASTTPVSRNEILASLNKPDDYILAIVEFLDGGDDRVYYIRRPFRREPDFGVTSVNYDVRELLARAELRAI